MNKTVMPGATVRFLVCLLLSISSQCVIGAPFFKSKPHRSAKNAYLERLKNELETTQNQLYTSQKTCITLRKRVDEQNRGSLSRDGDGAINNVNSIERNSDQTKIRLQDEEIKELKQQLKLETERFNKQVEQMELLEAELKEVQQWKENPIYEESTNQEQNDYEQQIKMLTLKLEAAEFAAKMQRNKSGKQEAGRTQRLKIELEGVRKSYSRLSVQLAKEAATEDKRNVTAIEQQKQMEEDMDQAIQLAFQAALESIDHEWGEKYQALQHQLDEMNHNTDKMKDEKDAALSRQEESLSDDQQRRLREKLTNDLTNELTDKITVQLTEELTAKIEKRYRKKYRKMQRELKSQASGADQQVFLQSEIEKVKEQYEAEYTLKLQQVQQQNEEQLQLQKERMRKLVRALLEREAEEKKNSSKAAKIEDTADVDSSHLHQVKKRKKIKDNHKEEIVTSSSVASSNKIRRSQTGVVPVRGSKL